MTSIKNISIPGANKLPIALDIFFNDEPVKKPVVIYAHGFNGFKDWGNFDLIAQQFAAAGFTFVKFNFSHNGTAPEQPEDFVNLEAFGENNYTRQLNDLRLVVDWVCDAQNQYQPHINLNNISLIGHSMGGGIAILHAATDNRIQKLVGWASIAECKTPWGAWPADKMQHWKETGVAYYNNSRTKQQMPMRYQLYEDYIQNKERLDIEKAIRQLQIPVLICHGNADPSVPVENARLLHCWQPSAQLFITGGDHVFNRKHPWTEKDLPAEMQTVVNKTLQFLNY
ncbi:MAG: alpha/beta hydrolase [Chitinophagaceae bacterium]|nr:alpha/beta hydrolase [Chitinophagaceae bacterium]